MGAYSYFLKGGVFANAETANLLILAFNIAELNTEGIISVLYPISAFFIGTFFSQMFIEKLGRRWIPTLLIVEIMALISLSLLPSETPDRVFHVVIAVLSSMQFNTFRKARGVAMSTLFCTAHLRGFGALPQVTNHRLWPPVGFHGLPAAFVVKINAVLLPN